jgi:hypothetical protein
MAAIASSDAPVVNRIVDLPVRRAIGDLDPQAPIMRQETRPRKTTGERGRSWRARLRYTFESPAELGLDALMT